MRRGGKDSVYEYVEDEWKMTLIFIFIKLFILYVKDVTEIIL